MSDNALPKRRRPPNAKLTIEQVREIRALAGKVGQDSLAARYGVTQRVIWDIIHNVSWREDGS